MAIQYWLFQSNPKSFDLKGALREEKLKTFAVKAHKDKIKEGDKLILWESGKNAACYGLAEVKTAVQPYYLSEGEKAFHLEEQEKSDQIGLKVLYNLWDRPITRDLLVEIPDRAIFNASQAGMNFKATKKQYEFIAALIVQNDQLNEAEVEYDTPDWINPPLNLILYGPPGTGKTYQTVNHALAIIENRPLDELALENRASLRQRFNEYMSAGQIGFVSFHPSFSYEDFVEGIRAETRNGQIFYTVRDGIFKMMSNEARRCLYETYLKDEPIPNSSIAFNELYSAFLQYIKSDAFNAFTSDLNRPIFLHRVLRFGHLAVRKAKSYSVQTVRKSPLKKLYEHIPDPSILRKAEQIKAFVGDDNPVPYLAVFKELKAFESKLQAIIDQQRARVNEASVEPLDVPFISNRVLADCKRYVLIIDELNRGNTASIFGELITLIEADKREGRSEAMTNILPYSKSYFSVPPNLYLLGTMNTIDRSVEALDIALRRRFAFQSMMPEPTVIKAMAKQPIIAGVNLQKMLIVMNKRLRLLIDDHHVIGHAYFMEISSLDDLRILFDGKIIPLLKEYFFNDLGKIGLVLGKAFVEQVKERDTQMTTFASFDHPFIGEFTNKINYQITDSKKWDEAAFIRIYDEQYV
jgi:5-methylcytosine-specific restriction protein B